MSDAMERGATRLIVPDAPGKRDMLKMLDHLREQVETGEIVGLMVTAIGKGMAFENYSCADGISASSRIGFLMCHVNDLVVSMHRV